MPLIVGSRIGPYEVLGVIGAGGMGEVYRARDTKLNREVAIKVLPATMAHSPRRLARFDREARALGALNHPNIATVFGIEDSGSGHGRAIVMELVEGEDLSARVRRGPIPISEALAIARQVAEALAAAHDAGIVHRDLKPANIKVRDDGTVKVLDFGLAKGEIAESDAESGSGSGSGSASGSGSGSRSGVGSAELLHTVTMHGDLTADGVVLGTAAYMSPEQAKGKVVDKRADIWAFGVVLFEMLAGRRPFAPGDSTDTMAFVLAMEPEWSVLPAGTPPAIRRLLVRCLTKDRKQRLHDIADARLEIDEAIAPRKSDQWNQATGNRAMRGQKWARTLAPAALWLLAGLAIGVFVWRAPSAVPLVTYARLDVSPATELNAGGVHPYVVLPAAGARTALAWSPDGRTLAFIGISAGARQVYLRDLAAETARPLAGTVGARALAFSPDGEYVAFWADGAIRRVKVAGGLPEKICDAKDVGGIAWGATHIAFSQGTLWMVEVSPSVGTPRVLTTQTELVRHASPFLLPGDRAILYTEYQKQWTSGDERVMVRSLAPGSEAKVLIEQAADARYLSSGHIAFLRQGTLFVVPFDARTLALRGEPVAVVKDVAQAVVAWDSVDLTLQGQFAISLQGTLVYVSSGITTYPDRQLVTIDRKGRIAPLALAPEKGYRSHLELSPDGTHLGVSIQSAADIESFSFDLARGNLSRLAESLKGEVTVASWARDNQIVVQVIADGKISTYLVRPDVASAPVPLTGFVGFWASSLSAQGRLLGMAGGDLLVYPTATAGARATVLMSTITEETQPMWSPDGHWIAYTSVTTGRPEVFVRPFPGPGEGTMVSVSGGSSAEWNPDGQELFYIEPGLDPGSAQDRMMAVKFASPDHPGKPETLFAFPRAELFLGTLVLTPYAVARDGQRFYGVRQLPRTSTPVTQVTVIFNWLEELKGKVPAAR